MTLLSNRARLKAKDERLHAWGPGQRSQLVAVSLQVGDRNFLLLRERHRHPVTEHEFDPAGWVAALDARVTPLVPTPPGEIRLEGGRCQEAVHVERLAVREQSELIHAIRAVRLRLRQWIDCGDRSSGRFGHGDLPTEIGSPVVLQQLPQLWQRVARIQLAQGEDRKDSR